MQILSYPKYTPSFASKKSEIRKADDIQRKTRTAFPFFSPHYAEDYYKSCSSAYSAKSSAKCLSHWDNVDRLERQIIKLNCVREKRNDDLCGRNNLTNKVYHTINDIQHYRVGNCEEASTLTMASLIANGFTNTLKCRLKLDTLITDKETGEEKYSISDSLDHAFVISTMDKDPHNQKTFYVVDSWFGFADTIEGAKTRYAKLTDESKFKKSKMKAINQFTNLYKSKEESSKGTFDINNYEIKQRIVFEKKEGSLPRDDHNIRQLFEDKFPQLILSEEK